MQPSPMVEVGVRRKQTLESSRRETEERGLNGSDTGHSFQREGQWQSSEGGRKGRWEVENASLLAWTWKQTEPENSTLGFFTRDAGRPGAQKHQHQDQCYPLPM